MWGYRIQRNKGQVQPISMGLRPTVMPKLTIHSFRILCSLQQRLRDLGRLGGVSNLEAMTESMVCVTLAKQHP